MGWITGDFRNHGKYAKPLNEEAERRQFRRFIRRLEWRREITIKNNLIHAKGYNVIRMSDLTSKRKPEERIDEVIHPSTAMPGKWQCTSFQGNLPLGHCVFTSKENAIRSVSGESIEGPAVGHSGFRVIERIGRR